ncbi:hypothetical protein MTY81_41150 [Mycolicibacterium sp. TY81]|nr:hypothetical protein MTY81_41150 [Mycolicibacterium sp. TY81]
MARKNYPDEFKRDAVALYRDTEGATITQIADELGISGVTLSAWCKAAGVPIRHRNPTAAAQPSPGVETPRAGAGPATGREQGVTRHGGSVVYRA